MNEKDIQWLASEEASEVLEAHADADPAAFALSFRGSGLPVPLLATQIGLRQRAADKLPTWKAAGCLFDGRALEQCSSEVACGMKFEGMSGEMAVDLTGGLGVDVWALAQRYGQVVYVEANPILCALARENFGRLGLANVEVVNGLAEEYVGKYEGKTVDLVYADPDRRDAQGRRQVRLQDCSPDILGLLPDIATRMGTGGQIMLKASPMLDVAALADELEGLGLERKLVVGSIDNEVKEVLALVGKGLGKEVLEVRHVRSGKAGAYLGKLGDEGKVDGFFPPENGEGWLAYEPDAAFYKSRLTAAFFRDHTIIGGGMNFGDGYFFSQEILSDFPGRVFRIRETMPFKPKAIRKRLKTLGIERALFSRRHFDLPLKEVEKRLLLPLGGEVFLLLTRQPSGERMAMLADRM